MVVSGMMIEEAARFSLSWYWGKASGISRRIRGAKLVAGDADAWYYLGESLQYDLDDSDPTKEIAYFRRSADLNPRSAETWMALASAYEADGDVPAAQEAYEKAHSDYPVSAKVAWGYGNFLLRHGRTSEGLEEIHRAVLTDPARIPMALTTVWTFMPDVNLILNSVLPADEDAYWQALDFFANGHNTTAGLTTWESLMEHSNWWPLELKRVFPFLDELIAQGRNDDAESVWKQALEASHWPEHEPSGTSVIWNGGFETDIAGGGLDWRIVPTPGASVSPDSTVTHSGTRSLRVNFTGGMNLDYAGVHELVPAEPSTVYELQAFLRTEDITTESGMCLEADDPRHPREADFFTPALTGTNSWTPVRVTVKTLPDTHFLDVRLRRLPSRLFDNKLGGTVWMDDVTLTPVTSASEKNTP